MTPEAVAFWIRAPGVGELRRATIPVPGDDEVLVRALRSGVSRGTEALVFRGQVPPDQYARMRAPFQEGDFPGPVKYGYLNVGVVEQGPDDLEGRTVFCLYPHQSRYVVPASAVVPVPDGVPPERAVLAGTVETAVNALWDAPPLVGDRVSVVGAGMVGCCVAKVAAGIPGARVTLVDVDPSRATVAAALGVAFASPADADGDQDLVVHTTATSAGLETSLRAPGRGDVGARPQLVRRPGDPALPRRPVPLRPARHPGQPGRDRLARPGRAVGRMPTGCASLSTCSRTRRTTRSSPGRPPSRSCPR